LLIHLPLDVRDDALIKIQELLRFDGIPAFLAHERVIGKVPVTKVNRGYSPTTPVGIAGIKDLADI